MDTSVSKLLFRPAGSAIAEIIPDPPDHGLRLWLPTPRPHPLALVGKAQDQVLASLYVERGSICCQDCGSYLYLSFFILHSTWHAKKQQHSGWSSVNIANGIRIDSWVDDCFLHVAIFSYQNIYIS